jgi:D-aminopeptidase
VAVINPYNIWLEYAETGPFAVLTSQAGVELYAILHWNIPSALFAGTSFQVTFTLEEISWTQTVSINSASLVTEE